MIRMAVVRWYLYALQQRWVRLRDRLLRPRALSEVDSNLAHLLLAAYGEAIGDPGGLGYRRLLRSREFKVSSQNGEDGLLAFIFSEIGVTNRKFVEFGVGDGLECNCANLAVWFGWSGLMLESDAAAARAGCLKAVSAEEAYYPQKKRLAVATVEQQLEAIQHLDFVEI